MLGDGAQFSILTWRPGEFAGKFERGQFYRERFAGSIALETRSLALRGPDNALRGEAAAVLPYLELAILRPRCGVAATITNSSSMATNSTWSPACNRSAARIFRGIVMRPPELIFGIGFSARLHTETPDLQLDLAKAIDGKSLSNSVPIPVIASPHPLPAFSPLPRQFPTAAPYRDKCAL